MALWKFGQLFNKQDMMAIYCWGQAVGAGLQKTDFLPVQTDF